jgi:hypothetical protein
MQRAEESVYRAKIERDPALARDFFEMERRWLSLARSQATTRNGRMKQAKSSTG